MQSRGRLPGDDDAPAAGDSAAGRSRHRLLRRVLRAVAVLLGLALVLLALARYGLPPLARSQAQKFASAQLGRSVAIGALEFTPWTLELELRDIVVATADGRSDQLRLGRVHVDAELQSLWRLAPVVDSLRIEQPRLSLTRLGSGRWDVDDILDRLSRPAGEAPADRPVARFALHNIEVVGGAADLVDRPLGRTHRLRDFRLALPFLSSLEVHRDVRIEPRLEFSLDGSRVVSTVVGTPFRADGRVEAALTLQKLDVRPFLGYLPESLPVRLRSAQLGADLKATFMRSPRASLRIAGSVVARDIAVTDRQSAALLDVGSVEVKIADLRPLEQTLALDRLAFTAPHVQVRRDRHGQVGLPLAAAAASAGTPRPAAVLPLPAPASARRRRRRARRGRRGRRQPQRRRRARRAAGRWRWPSCRCARGGRTFATRRSFRPPPSRCMRCRSTPGRCAGRPARRRRSRAARRSPAPGEPPAAG